MTSIEEDDEDEDGPRCYCCGKVRPLRHVLGGYYCKACVEYAASCMEDCEDEE